MVAAFFSAPGSTLLVRSWLSPPARELFVLLYAIHSLQKRILAMTVFAVFVAWDYMWWVFCTLIACLLPASIKFSIKFHYLLLLGNAFWSNDPSLLLVFGACACFFCFSYCIVACFLLLLLAISPSLHYILHCFCFFCLVFSFSQQDVALCLLFFCFFACNSQ